MKSPQFLRFDHVLSVTDYSQIIEYDISVLPFSSRLYAVYHTSMFYNVRLSSIACFKSIELSTRAGFLLFYWKVLRLREKTTLCGFVENSITL